MFLWSSNVETTRGKIHKLSKTQHIETLAYLKIPVSTFRKFYSGAADHVTKSDINMKFKMTATIMTWFSRGISLGIWESRPQWNMNTHIKTCIANPSIGYKDDLRHTWICPSLRSENITKQQDGQIWIGLVTQMLHESKCHIKSICSTSIVQSCPNKNNYILRIHVYVNNWPVHIKLYISLLSPGPSRP